MAQSGMAASPTLTVVEPAHFGQQPDLPHLPTAQLVQQAPDRHYRWQINGNWIAHCSLWWRHTLDGLGVIGHYWATDAIAPEVLRIAIRDLANWGCWRAVGPMDGQTWNTYRAISDRGTHPPFFLEPSLSERTATQFTAAQFHPLATYTSAIATDLTRRNPKYRRAAQRLSHLGVRFRAANLDQAIAELQRIHALSIQSFQHNLLYRPITLPHFLDQYQPLLPLLDPALIQLAEQGDHLIGVAFAIPDYNQAQRGDPITQVILKTVATWPDRRYAGLGGLLVERIHAIAQKLGYHAVIHALMHDANPSRNLSQFYAHPMRHYVLFERSLPESSLWDR
jgi:GNAT superfamily N-acetyltransferase